MPLCRDEIGRNFITKDKDIGFITKDSDKGLDITSPAPHTAVIIFRTFPGRGPGPKGPESFGQLRVFGQPPSHHVLVIAENKTVL